MHESVVVLDEFALQRKIFCYASPPDQLIEAANYSLPYRRCCSRNLCRAAGKTSADGRQPLGEQLRDGD